MQDQLKAADDESDSEETKSKSVFTTPSLIILNQRKRIKDVDMGSHHILALSTYYEIFSWGKNDKGQLGLGFVSTKVDRPTLIQNMIDKRIKSVSAWYDYSACLSYFGELYTWGSWKYGKLGNGISKDWQIDFEKVETDDRPIARIGMGKSHMAAIIAYDSGNEKKDGKTLVWGRNHRGQLGIGTWDNQSIPVEVDRIHQENIRLVRITCGSSFTLGITKNKKLYFSGKRKFWGKPNETLNINEMK